MNWTIRNKLFGLSAVGLLLIMVVGAAGYYGTTRVDSSMDQIVTMNSMLRNHLDADMMHDALRADVLAALLAGESSDQRTRDDIRTDLRAHSDLLRSGIAENKDLVTDNSLRDDLGDAEKALEAYVKSAESIIALAFLNQAEAQAQMPQFLVAFSDLEEEMSGLSDKIEDGVRTAQAMGDEAVKTAMATIMAFGIGAFIVLGLIAVFVTRSITSPLYMTIEVLKTIAAGDLTQDLKLDRNDEIGDVFNAIRQMKQNLVTMIGSISDTASNVANSSEELSAVSSQMSSNAEETSTQATVVSAAAEQVSKNLQSVSTGSEEMMSSIKEIARNSNEAAKVAGTAVRVADQTNATISKLGDSSTEIGQVIKVITSIAQQTNLLALNATIEAARAGEAGKGFAVVANEVKELAKETAKATEEISQKIETIQGDSKESVDAIAEITTIISQISDISSTIAASVEEQTATSTEMGRNVGEAAKGGGEIAENISGVAKAALDTSSGAANSQSATAELARMAQELQAIVSQFKLEEGSSGGNGRLMSARGQQHEYGQVAHAPVSKIGTSVPSDVRRQEQRETVHS